MTLMKYAVSGASFMSNKMKPLVIALIIGMEQSTETVFILISNNHTLKTLNSLRVLSVMVYDQAYFNFSNGTKQDKLN